MRKKEKPTRRPPGGIQRPSGPIRKHTWSSCDGERGHYSFVKEIANAEAKKIADKASANAKLKALGLTDDEIEAFRS